MLIHKSIFRHNHRNNTHNIVMHSRDHCMQYVQPFSKIKKFINLTQDSYRTARGLCLYLNILVYPLVYTVWRPRGFSLFVFLKPNQDLTCIFSNTRDMCIRIFCIILLIVYWKFRKTLLLLLHFEALCTRMIILCTLLKLSNSNLIEQQKNYLYSED